MTSNEDKSIEECLQLLIKQLRHLQHDLNSELRSERFIHNKLINCQNDDSETIKKKKNTFSKT